MVNKELKKYSINSDARLNKISPAGRVLEGFISQSDAKNKISLLLESYNVDDRQLIKEKLKELDIANKKALATVLPTGIVPIYLTPMDPETQVLESATWAQYSEVGPYSGIDDGYCRPEDAKSGSWVYPRRNPTTMEIELASCDKLINNDVKTLAQISGYVPGLLELSNVKLLMLDADSANDTKELRTSAESLADEYNKLHDQYIQLTKLLETNMELINKRRTLINKSVDDLERKENDYNIKREYIRDDVISTKEWDKKLASYYFYMKLIGAVFILITIMLVLLIDIGKVL